MKVSKFRFKVLLLFALLTTLCYGVFLVWSFSEFLAYKIKVTVKYTRWGIPLHNLDHIQYRNQWYGGVAVFGVLVLAIVWLCVFCCLQSVWEG